MPGMTRKLVHGEVGARIARVRLRLGLRRYQFAKVLGVTRTTAGNYEKGQMPRADILDKIAGSGDVTVEWLLHGNETKGKATTRLTRRSDIEPRFLWPDVAPRDLLKMPPRYLERYQVRLQDQISRLRRELDEYRQVLRLEYGAERARRRRRNKFS